MTESDSIVSQYLSTLAGTHRLENYTFTPTGAGGALLVAKFNPNRVYIYIEIGGAIGQSIVIKGPTGMFTAPRKTTSDNLILSINESFCLPQLEFYHTNTGATPPITAWGIIREHRKN